MSFSNMLLRRNNAGTTMGVRRTDKEYASKVNAALARKDWDDYKRNFMPVHREFKDLVMGDKLVNEQLDRVPQNIDASYARQQQGADARVQRMGLANADMGRMDINKALDTTGAENNVRQHAKDRSLAAVAGAPMPTIGG